MPCGGHIIIAPLWVAYEANLGTLLRTCDAVGACMAVPDTAHYHDCLRRGDTLRVRPCVHWVDDKVEWIDRERRRGASILGVELDDDSLSLRELFASRQRTVVLLGNESKGLPLEIWPYLDHVVQIPMMGVGDSLNVAVAGSLVAYRLAGLS